MGQNVAEGRGHFFHLSVSVRPDQGLDGGGSDRRARAVAGAAALVDA
jgi:hypothetical protein